MSFLLLVEVKVKENLILILKMCFVLELYLFASREPKV